MWPVIYGHSNKRKNKLTFCHSNICSSFYLTEAPQHILHEASKSWQENTFRKKIQYISTACPFFNEHLCTHMHTHSRSSPCMRRGLCSPGVIAPCRATASTAEPRASSWLWITLCSPRAMPGLLGSGAVGVSPLHITGTAQSQEALQSCSLSQPPSIRIPVLPVISSTVKEGVKKEKTTTTTTTRIFFHVCGQCSCELPGNEPKHGALQCIITLSSKSACNC